MKALKKAESLPIRFSSDELRRARRAAKIVTKQSQKVMHVGTLIREQAMIGVDAILARGVEAASEPVGTA